MNTDVFRYFSDIVAKEISPGFNSRLFHTENNTLSLVEVKAGCVLPVHQHVHHQCTIMLDGQFDMTVDGELNSLKPGSLVVIPSNAAHGGVAISDCKILDIFSPVREDYRDL